MKKRYSQPEVKKGVCEYHLCRKRTTVYRCKYCGKYFCEDHIKPLPVIYFDQVIHAEEPIRSELEKIWRSKEGHPCYPYTQIFWEDLIKKEKEEQEEWKKTLNKLLTPAPSSTSVNQIQNLATKETNELQGKNDEGNTKKKAEEDKFLTWIELVIILILLAIIFILIFGKFD